MALGISAASAVYATDSAAGRALLIPVVGADAGGGTGDL